MRRSLILAVAIVAAMGQTRAPEAQLAQARRLYNEQRYADAIKIADEARQVAAIAAPAVDCLRARASRAVPRRIRNRRPRGRA